jgi:hypothetical protein
LFDLHAGDISALYLTSTGAERVGHPILTCFVLSCKEKT